MEALKNLKKSSSFFDRLTREKQAEDATNGATEEKDSAKPARAGFFDRLKKDSGTDGAGVGEDKGFEGIKKKGKNLFTGLWKKGGKVRDTIL